MSSRSSSASSSSSSSDNSDTEMKKEKKSSGSDRSRSPSRSGSEKSRASSRSKSPEKASSVRTRSSSSGSSSPRFVSATSSDASGSKKSDASSTTSSKGKRKMKAKDRKVSNKMAEKLKKSDESEDEESHHSSDDERRKKSSKAPAKKSTPAKGGRKGKKDQSEEEGEIASDDKEFDDGLDEDLIGDDEDRARLEDMTEREREEELFKRAENRENLRKRFEIQKKLKQQQKLKNEEKKDKKPASDESEEEEGQRSDSGSDSDKGKSQAKKGSDESGDENYGMGGYGTIQDAKERSQDRRKNLDAMKYDKKSSALSELKAKRQERERRDMERAKKEKEKSKDDDSGSESPEKSRSDRDRKKSKKTSKRRSRSRSSSSSSGPAQRRTRSSSSSSSKSSKSSRSGSSSGSASDTERFHKSPSRQTQKYIETQEDLEPIRLSRFKLEKFVHLPFFKKLVTGCFVRIGIGSFEGRSVYRAAEVADVVETAKVYSVGKARTNVGLKLRFGKQERVFRLEFISNSTITPQEFEKWRQTCSEAAITFPTLEFVKSKSAEIKKALSYEFSSDDVDKMVAAKEKFSKHPVNYAMHKARLMKERDAALTTGDEARAREFDLKLSEIEERAEELDRKRTSTISAVSLINDRNRKANVSKAEVAIMREIRKRKLHGFESNPFTRRKCNPRIVTKNVGGDDPTLLEGVVSGSAEHKENQVKVAADAKRKADTAAADEATAKKKKTAADAAAQQKKEDLFDAHDFDIEIDVDTTVAGPVNASKPLLSTGIGLGKDGLGSGLASRPTKRSLNLDDYKKKRGLI